MVFYKDADGDGYGDPGNSMISCFQPSGYVSTPGDCDDSNPDARAFPSEVGTLLFENETTISWAPPGDPGGWALTYDVLGSSDCNDFSAAAVCLATDVAATSTVTMDAPPVGSIWYYLVRGRNACASGTGTLGVDSSGHPRTGRTCP